MTWKKSAAYDFTHELLTTLEVDDPAMVAKQMELVLLFLNLQE